MTWIAYQMHKGGKKGHVKTVYPTKANHIYWKHKCGIDDIGMKSFSRFDLTEKIK